MISFPIMLPVDAEVLEGSFDDAIRVTLTEFGGDAWQHGAAFAIMTFACQNQGNPTSRVKAALTAGLKVALEHMPASERDELNKKSQKHLQAAMRRWSSHLPTSQRAVDAVSK